MLNPLKQKCIDRTDPEGDISPLRLGQPESAPVQAPPAMATPTDLPNPTTPLAWLDPALAGQLEVSRYLYVATCGVCFVTLRNALAET